MRTCPRKWPWVLGVCSWQESAPRSPGVWLWAVQALLGLESCLPRLRTDFGGPPSCQSRFSLKTLQRLCPASLPLLPSSWQGVPGPAPRWGVPAALGGRECLPGLRAAGCSSARWVPGCGGSEAPFSRLRGPVEGSLGRRASWSCWWWQGVAGHSATPPPPLSVLPPSQPLCRLLGRLPPRPAPGPWSGKQPQGAVGQRGCGDSAGDG